MPVLITLPTPRAPIWYLAYGSNLSSQKFIHDRRITPIRVAVVTVPGYSLTMDSAGVPYSEPAFASISASGLCTPPDKKVVQLIGTAYLVTPDMYSKVIASEGGGIAYREAEVQAKILKVQDEGESFVESDEIIIVRTLATVLQRAARPSERYMNIIRTGAKEAHMPQSYQDFLSNIPTYHPPKRGVRKTGAKLFLTFWLPVMALMEKITKASLTGRSKGDAPLWVVVMVRAVVYSMWWWHDHVHAQMWGRGDGLDELESGDIETSTRSSFSSHRKRNSYHVSVKLGISLLALMILAAFHGRKHVHWTKNPDDIFSSYPLIDGHNDFPIWIRAFYHNHIYQSNFSDRINLYGQVDFPRLKRGKLGAQFWSVYVECPKDSHNDFSDSIYHEIVHDTIQQIDLVYRLIKQFPTHLRHTYSSSEIEAQFKETTSNGISSLLGIEGLHQIGNSASILRMYYALGVRYATLTHTCHNTYADSEEPLTPFHGGLSEKGVQMVKEMNRMGMMVDLSHTSFQTQRDAIKVSLAPVIYSHSSAYTICNHTRNVPDDILFSLKKNDGVIMITFYPQFTDADAEKASLEHVADHVEYVGSLIGYRHVGIGSDFDGMAHGPRGLEDVSKYPDLVAELLGRGISRVDVGLVMGKNIIRVLGAVERVAAELSTVQPLEDNVKSFFE